MMKFVLGAAVVAVVAVTADACTGMYAGKKVTADGSVLIGRTVDFSPYNATMRQQVCEPGTQVSFAGKVNRYRYVCAPKSASLKAGRYAGSAANEKGVILSGTVTGATRAEALANDPFVPVEKGGVGEPNLPDYLIGNAATAREAVNLLGEAVATNGHAGAEIYMVADTNEAWYVEVYTGRDWAAVKMPEDQVAVFGNHFNLRGFDADAVDTMCSPTLVSRAVAEKFAVWADAAQTKLDLFLTYADPGSVTNDYSNYRAWYGHRRFSPSTLPTYSKDLIPALFYKPDYKIAPTNMFELMRARYEDLSDEELPTPRTNAAIRVIGTVKQGNCHVLQLDCRPSTPAWMRGTVWSCLGNCEHGVFHPINAAQDALPDAYTNDAQQTFGYDLNRAADAFRRLSALAQADRVNNGTGVRAYWRSREARMAVEWPTLVNYVVTQDDARELSAYTFAEEERSLAAARRMYDELLWYMAENNRIPGDVADGKLPERQPFKPTFRLRLDGAHAASGGIQLQIPGEDFRKAGFTFGDTVDIRFSNGAFCENVPVYNGYYTNFGEPLVICHEKCISVLNNMGGDFFVELGLSEPFSAEVTLREPGGCLAVQTALSLVYTDRWDDYESDEVFANFRAMGGGSLVPNLFFRGASPCDNQHNRSPYVSGLLDANGVQCVIDLADTQEKIAAYRRDGALPVPYWKQLVDDGKVHAHPVVADFTVTASREGNVAALRTILENPGPYYVHCLEGKDRTGFLCILIESLAGATLEEIQLDYMITFANYYGIDPDVDLERCRQIRDVFFGNLVSPLAECPLAECTTEKLNAGVKGYLETSGMSKDEIASLVAKLTGKEVR